MEIRVIEKMFLKILSYQDVVITQKKFILKVLKNSLLANAKIIFSIVLQNNKMFKEIIC